MSRRRPLLTALAFAEAPGIPLDLWQAAAQALGAGQRDYPAACRGSPDHPQPTSWSNPAEDGRKSVFRLFHQALNDALLRARAQIAAPQDDQRALTQAFTAVGRQRGWGHAPRYLLRSLAVHAAAAGMIDDLLADDVYLLHADLRHLIPLADHAISTPGRQRARLLRLTPRAITADPATRIALFSVTESLENLGHSYTTSSSPAPYRAIWAEALPRMERAVLEGDTGMVNARVRVHPGRPHPAGQRRRGREGADLGPGHRHAASRPGRPPAGLFRCAPSPWTAAPCWPAAVDDSTVRIWDPATGTQQAVLHGHTSPVSAVCAFSLDGRTLLASGGDDKTVRIWDPATGTSKPS